MAELETPDGRGDRGHLDIRERVLTRVAVAAAKSLPDVAAYRTRFARRDLPNASVAFARTGLRTPADAHITLDVATAWPARLSHVTHELRARVGKDIAALTGEHPARIDIRVSAFAAARESHHATVEGEPEHPPHPPTIPHDPLSTPAALYFGLIAGAGLIVLGAIGVRDFLIFRELLPGPAWIPPTLESLVGTGWQNWMYFPAAAALVVGVYALIAAVLPRRKTHFRLATEDPAWMRPKDIARRCSALAREIPGVINARTTVSRKRAIVTIDVSNAGDPGLHDRVHEAVQSGLVLLQDPLAIEVKVGSAIASDGVR
ncbi:DUF6286 domain-containing protein [Hoyosella subflava]|uniref:DUF6286 domain-containing protein n=1 Tax=Hoyosella subflava (strain DSM 45089 / JCM 17490 / NBRC 109087 / DQS3-9A1) TaxID=443218 RepID=F6EHX5_HOYSD|nr:DUF6286 domain-containing protein [Hoyosella subflava]AEF38923.1 hypothetical protein AS9A_0466 [Hoyosella subflava DQS3-9A1]